MGNVAAEADHDQAGGVAVNVGEQGEFCKYFRVIGKYAGEVHHFPESENAGFVSIFARSAAVMTAPPTSSAVAGTQGGEGEENVVWCVLCVLHHEVDSGESCDIGNFVGVGNCGGDAV